jgi:hypothetical protein
MDFFKMLGKVMAESRQRQAEIYLKNRHFDK